MGISLSVFPLQTLQLLIQPASFLRSDAQNDKGQYISPQVKHPQKPPDRNPKATDICCKHNFKILLKQDMFLGVGGDEGTLG